MSDAELVVVHTFSSQAEADMAVSALDAAGIAAMVRSDSGGQQRPSIAWAGSGYQVLVRGDDAAAAREVLELPARRA